MFKLYMCNFSVKDSFDYLSVLCKYIFTIDFDIDIIDY